MSSENTEIFQKPSLSTRNTKINNQITQNNKNTVADPLHTLANSSNTVSFDARKSKRVRPCGMRTFLEMRLVGNIIGSDSVNKAKLLWGAGPCG